MTGWRKRTIMEMAREADPKANLSEPYRLDPETITWLEAFAALVREDEREACAKVCKNVVSNKGFIQSKWCAEAIRARGDKHDKLLRVLQAPCFYNIDQI